MSAYEVETSYSGQNVMHSSVQQSKELVDVEERCNGSDPWREKPKSKKIYPQMIEHIIVFKWKLP